MVLDPNSSRNLHNKLRPWAQIRTATAVRICSLRCKSRTQPLYQLVGRNSICNLCSNLWLQAYIWTAAFVTICGLSLCNSLWLQAHIRTATRVSAALEPNSDRKLCNNLWPWAQFRTERLSYEFIFHVKFSPWRPDFLQISILNFTESILTILV